MPNICSALKYFMADAINFLVCDSIDEQIRIVVNLLEVFVTLILLSKLA